MVTPAIPLRVRHFGVYSDKGCNSQLATLTADGNGDTKEVEVKAGTVYIKELSAPRVTSWILLSMLKCGSWKTATLTVADTPKVTETLIDLFKSTWKQENPLHRELLL